MRKVVLFVVMSVFAVAAAHADVSVLEHNSIQHKQEKARHRGSSSLGVLATGSQSLVDASGLEYFINTNITFSTSSSGSAAMSEASYTHAVAASTSGGGTTMSTLNDMFDGYNELCVTLGASPGITCETGNASFTPYIKNGPATLDASCNDRQVIFPNMTVGNLTVWRKVFVPTNDSFARWLNYVTNNGATAQQVTFTIANNLGSDSNTRIVSSTNGDNVAQTSDTWITSFQNYSGTTSSDPRIGHVLFGAGASIGLSGLNFVDGDDNPWWSYTFTVQPGATAVIMGLVTGQPSKAAVNAKAAELAGLPPNTLQCMTPTDKAELLNFAAPAAIPTVNFHGLLLLGMLLGLVGVASILMLGRRL